MKLRAELAGNEHQLSVTREGVRLLAEVDERRYELEARETEAGVYTLLLDGRVYECRIEGAAAEGGATRVEIRGRTYEATLLDPRKLRGARGAAGTGEGRAAVVAPMPGKVVRVLVEQGEEVEAGQPVVVVEAMKMQNELKTPRAGVIVELHAQVGATVNAGEVLAVIE